MRVPRYLAAALVIVASAAVLDAAPGAAQQRPAPGAAPGAPSDAELERWAGELRQLHVRLEGIQRRALEDTALLSEQTRLGEAIKAAMQRADPQLDAQVERIAALEEEARRAGERGDEARFRSLAQEAQTIHHRFAAAQAAAFGDPGIAARLEAFQARLEARMAEVDAEAPVLIQRFQRLEARLNSALQGRQRG